MRGRPHTLRLHQVLLAQLVNGEICCVGRDAPRENGARASVQPAANAERDSTSLATTAGHDANGNARGSATLHPPIQQRVPSDAALTIQRSQRHPGAVNNVRLLERLGTIRKSSNNRHAAANKSQATTRATETLLQAEQSLARKPTQADRPFYRVRIDTGPSQAPHPPAACQGGRWRGAPRGRRKNQQTCGG